ncbi:MAG: polysaccharide deacetylase family protein [Candidatus Korobacteraceae bacterium]
MMFSEMMNMTTVPRFALRAAMLITLLASFALPSLAAEKLIALTFDDGPRPYVLYGVKQPGAASSANPGLLDVLDRNGVKATFFYMGWRLTPKTWGETPHETNIGVTCLEAAHDVLRRGHEIENHTYSHANLRVAERKKGEAWVLNDVERGAGVVEAVTGSKPLYLRPPDWDLTDDARGDLEKHGFHILTISGENPVALRDINSQDYLCAGKGVGCPRPSLAQSVLRTIEQREKKGVTTDILAFHELTTTTAQLPELIAALKAKGYRFVTVTEYMKLVR